MDKELKKFIHGKVQIFLGRVSGFYKPMFSIECLRAWKFGYLNFNFLKTGRPESLFTVLIDEGSIAFPAIFFGNLYRPDEESGPFFHDQRATD